MGEDFLRNEERVVMRYNSVLDLHTHTLVSGHAYCSLREMAKAAADKGLEVLGITEHAPAMPGTYVASMISICYSKIIRILFCLTKDKI